MADATLSLTVRVMHPPAGVSWALQLGRDELAPPVRRTGDALEFQVDVRQVIGTDGTPDFRGPAVQGPRGGRFLYLTSGKRAGDFSSCWDRRAKVSLEGLRAQLEVHGNDQAAEASIAGTGKDGGPACASVALLDGWRLLP